MNQAWCSECDEILSSEGEWTDSAKNFADPRFVCLACYRIGKRTLLLECATDRNSLKPHTRIFFSGIRSYSEEAIDDEYDDICMDGVVGMHWIREHIFCLHTEKKEIILEIESEPRVEIIA